MVTGGGMQPGQSEPSRVPKPVNELLATSRAEHARHLQNVSRTRHLPRVAGYSPTLPFSEPPFASTSAPLPSKKKVPGPAAPPSWLVGPSGNARTVDITSSSSDAIMYRTSILSFIYCHLPTPHDFGALPTLVDFCLLSLILPEFDEDAVSYLPLHLRFKIARLAAIYRPLSSSELLSAWGDGFTGVEGEAIIVGQQAYSAFQSLLQRTHGSSTPDIESWDTPLYLREAPQIPALQTLILIRTPMPSLTSLPPSITHLALLYVNFDTTRFKRALPKALPLLEWLDLSGCDGINAAWCESVDWKRWTYLKAVRLKLSQGGQEEERRRLTKLFQSHGKIDIVLD